MRNPLSLLLAILVLIGMSPNPVSASPKTLQTLDPSPLFRPLEILDDYEVPEPVVIVIDPGHGPWVNLDMEPIAPGSTTLKRKYGVGASGNFTGQRERDINLNVSLMLRDALTQAGFKVIMTRTDNTVISSNIDRVNIANDAQADLMIRVHSDSFKDPEVNGASMLVPADVGTAGPIVGISRKYGKIILDTLIDEVGMKRRGLFERSDQTGFNWSKVPIMTVELGFLSNEKEDRLLATQDYRDKLAKALYDGISKCFPDPMQKPERPS